MKRLQEKVKVLMNSTYSSLVDYGLTNSQFADLSSVSEDEVEENKGTQYQNLGAVDHDVYERIGVPGTVRTEGKQREHRTILAEPSKHAKGAKKNKAPLASPFELAPKLDKKMDEDGAVRNQDVLLLDNQNDPISKSVQHYFIDKKHQANQKEKNRNAPPFNMFSPDPVINDAKPLTNANPEPRPGVATPQSQSPQKKFRLNFRSPRVESTAKNSDRSQLSDQKSQESNVTLAQIQRMTGTSSFNDSGDSSMLREQELNSNQNEYSLTLKVNYKTDYGQEIAVIGSIPQLGNWDQERVLKMKWTEGHYWVAENIRVSESKGDPTYFQYKYVMMRKGHLQFYERGINRIADLKLLKHVDNKNQILNQLNDESSVGKSPDFVYDTYPNWSDNKNACAIKNVQINDCWEYFSVNFQIFNPMLDKNEDIQINGDHIEIGNWNINGPKPMLKKLQRSSWLVKEKYGHKVKFNQFPCQIQNSTQHTPIVMRYNYSKRSGSGKLEYEREPCRVMRIQDPHKYKGQLRESKNNSWLNCEHVWVVNGQINKIDSNFRVHFRFSQIADTNLFVGNCPITEDDVIQISRAGIRGVLNLKNNLRDRDHLKQFYDKHDICEVQNFPIPEFNKIDNLSEKLLEAVKVVDQMRKKLNQQRILVHCHAGMTRSPSLIILYLCLYCQVDFWKSPIDVYKLVKDHHSISYPNMKSIFRIIARNRTLQYHQCLLLQAEYQKRAALEEQKRQKLLEQGRVMQERLETLQAQLAERRDKRKADRKLRHEQRQKDLKDLDTEELNIQKQKEQLRQIYKLQEESVDALNKTNEMLKQNLQDQSILIDEDSYKNELRLDSQRLRKSLNVSKGEFNITPRIKSRTNYRKHQNSNKKNKSCTPTKLKSKSKNTVPVSKLNIKVNQNDDELAEEDSGDISPLYSKDQSQNDNSFLKMLQKSQMMGSDIGSKELDHLEPPTKSFDEGHNKSDISANNRSIKYKPNIFAYHNGFMSNEHSPIRSRQNQRMSITNHPGEQIAPFETLGNRPSHKAKPQDKDVHENAVNKILNNNYKSTKANTAVATLLNSQEVQNNINNDSQIQQEQQDIDAPAEQPSPVFEYDSLDQENADQDDPNLVVDNPPPNMHSRNSVKLVSMKQSVKSEQSLQPVEYPVPITWQNSIQRSSSKEGKSDVNQDCDVQEEKPQNFNQVLHFELVQSDSEQKKQMREPSTPHLNERTERTKRMEISPCIRSNKYLRDSIGAMTKRDKIQDQQLVKLDLEHQVNPFEMHVQEVSEKSLKSLHMVEQETEPNTKKILNQSDYETFEPDNLRDHIRLIDQIQQRSNIINNQVREQIKQKKEKRECSADSHRNVSQLYYGTINTPHEGKDLSQLIIHNKQSSSPSHFNNTSQMDNTLVISEARDLLNQNKQDLYALKESPQQKFVDSFVSQKGEYREQKFNESFKSVSNFDRTVGQMHEKESQFKVDTKFPLDDFDSVQKDMRIERYLAALGLGKQEIETKSEQMFSIDAVPIPFKCRPKVLIDEKINVILNETQSTIPVLNVRGSTYLIGLYKFSCKLENDQVMITNQQGREMEFKDYVIKNQSFIKQMLVIQTILCKQNLNYVINSHMVDQCIPELQKIEKEIEVDSHVRCLSRPSQRLNTSYRNKSNRTQSETQFPHASMKDTPQPKVDLQTPDDRQIDLQQLELKPNKTMQNTPHSRNKKETITCYNSTPCKNSPEKEDAVDINVQIYKPKVQPVSYQAKNFNKRKGHQRNRKESHTLQISISDQKEISSTSLALEKHSRKSKIESQTQDQIVTTVSQQSSKKLSASQIQIQLAREKQKIIQRQQKDLMKIGESTIGTAQETMENTKDRIEEKLVLEQFQDSKPVQVDVKNLKKVSPLYKQTVKKKIMKGQISADSTASQITSFREQTKGSVSSKQQTESKRSKRMSYHK